jgi:spermidine/putrescine transport system substrate-binding protein
MHKNSGQTYSSTVQLGRRGFVAGAAALAAGIAAGLRPAFADTQVVWVGWQGYDEPLKLGSFLADNRISLATTYINTNEEIITRLQAGGAGQTDLITIYFGHIPILVAADLLEPIDESKLPGIKDVFPEFLNVDPIRRDGKLYAMPFTWGTLSMIYDPAAAPKPTSWKDCLKEEYKGKVSLVDDATGLLATWAPIVTGTKTPTRITMDELKKTIDFLIEIKKNHARTLASSYGEATDMFARGEVVTSAIGWDAMVGFAAAKQKTLDFVIPEEGVMVFMDTVAIPKGAPHLDLAYKMLEQCISAEGQKHIADTLTQAVIRKAAVPLVDAKNREIYHYDDLATLFQKARFYPFWPLEPEGDFITHDQSQEEYQRFLKA